MGAPVVAADVSALRSLPVGQYDDGQIVTLLGYHDRDDGGGGLFAYRKDAPPKRADGTDVDDGVFFVPTSGGTGHFQRLYDGPAIRAEWFGADPAGRRLATAAIQAAVDYALEKGI